MMEGWTWAGTAFATALGLPVLAITVWLFRIWFQREGLTLPGPPRRVVVGNATQLDPALIRFQLTEWGQKFGSVFMLKLFHIDVVVVSDESSITEALADRGEATAGRPMIFRNETLFRNTGLMNRVVDDKWKLLRNGAQRKMKLFGSFGHSSEKTLLKLSNDMVEKFAVVAESKTAQDVEETIRFAALKSLAYLLCDDMLPDNDQLLSLLATMDHLFAQVVCDFSWDFLLLDLFPFLIHTPLRSSRALLEAVRNRDKALAELVARALKHDKGETLIGFITGHQASGSAHGHGDSNVDEFDAGMACISLLVAGLTTTSASFYALLNILAHNPIIQQRMHEEMEGVLGPSTSQVTLRDRPDLRYNRATLYELLRFHTVAPFGVPRVVTKSTEIKGIVIPKGTQLLANMWGLHHDENFWGDPQEFRPERFLDDNGDILPPEHPKRKHLMPFSAGIRSCPGEQTAVDNLFLWMTNTIRRFEITPPDETEGGSESSLWKSEFYVQKGNILCPRPHKIRFKCRK